REKRAVGGGSLSIAQRGGTGKSPPDRRLDRFQAKLEDGLVVLRHLSVESVKTSTRNQKLPNLAAFPSPSESKRPHPMDDAVLLEAEHDRRDDAPAAKAECHEAKGALIRRDLGHRLIHLGLRGGVLDEGLDRPDSEEQSKREEQRIVGGQRR